MSMWPQITLLLLVAFEFALHCAKAGEQRRPYNPVESVFNIAVLVGLLWAGGFFAPLAAR